MIRSMTGFGAAAARAAAWRIDVSVRTLNHRFLSVRIRGISERPGLQAKAERFVRTRFDRGEINVWFDVSRERDSGDGAPIDRESAAEMHAALCALSDDLDMGKPTLSDLIRTGAVQLAEADDEGLWEAIRKALEDATTAVLEARQTEGSVLAAEIERILTVLRTSVTGVVERLPEIHEEMRTRLSERAGELEINLDPERLEAEVVLLVERHDVQEEIARLVGHFDRVESLQDAKKPVGKELDFISQEMLREVNTIGSKVRDAVVSGLVIDMKVAVEQLREQVQNVE